MTYDERKAARKQTQARHLNTVRSLPERSQAAALFGLWPERLPKLVRRAINKETLADWRGLREQAHHKRWERLHQEIMIQEEAQERAFIHMALEQKYAKEASEIETLIAAIPNLKYMTVTAAEGQGGVIDFSTGEDVENEARFAILIALHFHGSIVLRQTLPLRTQITNQKGKAEWVQQERLYGISCLDGQWTAVSEAEMRTAYGHDQHGNPLPRDPATSFGTLKEQARKIKRKPH